MGRPKRADASGHCYHMLNRANLRATIFEKEADYEAFEKIIDEGIERFEIDLFAYCVMPNHYHLLVRPGKDGEMGRFGHYIGLTHTQRYHAHYKTTGLGHLYQGRFKSFPVQTDEHFLTVARYVERNAFAAKLCKRPEDWRFGSLHHWQTKSKSCSKRISGWPIRRTANWVQHVATEFSTMEREQLDWSVKRGVPFGNETWVEHIARTFDLESTMRPRGRPKKISVAK
ncbi:transposase [Allorhodopirellula solitaria]|uniref:Transposase IS200 like protein n=1 Tax=Allorhodopirellula solitaria TaxID=2527987 RepID=A0A5C5Y0G4_9BACT|nr:transposase [Allorhodopirellula solitaria]TWT67132.1 Transposase IS200 like protein [Allorhodopirellula solitaria]